MDSVLEQWSFVSLAPTVLIGFTVYKVYWLLVTPLHWLYDTHVQVYEAEGLPTLRLVATGHMAWAKSHSVFR